MNRIRVRVLIRSSVITRVQLIFWPEVLYFGLKFDILDRVGCPYNHKTALQTEESEPKRCEVVQCRRLLGDVAMEGAHVQRRWANGLRNSRQLAITVTTDPPTTADLQTEESGPKRCEVVQCRRMLGDVAMEEAHV